MGIDDPSLQTDHAHLMQTLSTMMVQLDALQILVSEDIANNVGITSAPYIPDIEAIREGLTALEQLTRNMLYEVQAASGDYPQSELVGVTLTEALSRTVEETA